MITVMIDGVLYEVSEETFLESNGREKDYTQVAGTADVTNVYQTEHDDYYVAEVKGYNFLFDCRKKG